MGEVPGLKVKLAVPKIVLLHLAVPTRRNPGWRLAANRREKREVLAEAIGLAVLKRTIRCSELVGPVLSHSLKVG